jgi:hypothetical protein
MLLSSAAETMLPLPSQTFCWQLPATPALTNVPDAACEKPQTFDMHVTVAHAVFVPGQSLAELQPTHMPVLLQNMPVPHPVPWATGVWDGTPLVQEPVVHAPDGGVSLASATEMMLPAPSHTFRWQSPGVWAAVAVPSAACDVPQVLESHVLVAHSVSAPGHWEAVLQPTHTPFPLQCMPSAAPHWVFSGAGVTPHIPLLHVAVWHASAWQSAAVSHWAQTPPGQCPL